MRSLVHFFHEETALDATGGGEVAVAVAGECSLGLSLRVGDVSFPLRDVQPKTAVLPTNGELVLRVPDAEWQRALARAKK